MAVIRTAFLVFFLPLIAYAQEDGAQVPDGSVLTVRALDKVTARIQEFDVPINEEKTFGALVLRARYCRTTPPIEPPETYAYLEIDEVKPDGTRVRVFGGWMLASSPALNPFEHPVYDVWVLSCTARSPESRDGPGSGNAAS